jgi:hypothetical protein
MNEYQRQSSNNQVERIEIAVEILVVYISLSKTGSMLLILNPERWVCVSSAKTNE